MKEEFEVKFLNIDPQEIEEKILAIGAKKAFDRIFKVMVFDHSDFRLNAEAAWLRLRDQGDKVVLTFKRRLGTKTLGENDDGMEEYEVEVSDFETTKKIILNSGLIEKFYEEKRRIQFILDDLEFNIDTYPALKPFLEIEGPSWQRVDEAIKMLGLDPKDKKITSGFQIYEMNGINMMDYKELTFKGLIKREK